MKWTWNAGVSFSTILICGRFGVTFYYKRISGNWNSFDSINQNYNDFSFQCRLKKANKNVAPKIVAVWSSALTSAQCLSPHNFGVQIWGGSEWQENYALLQSGFNVIMSHVDAWYLDCGFGSWRTTGEGACSPYTTWQHAYKHRPWEKMRLEAIKMKQVRATSTVVGNTLTIRFFRIDSWGRSMSMDGTSRRK